jgi:hypothetical protein
MVIGELGLTVDKIRVSLVPKDGMLPTNVGSHVLKKATPKR